ncbi:MAG: hypothetical protein WC391_06020 [Methanoregula sp.]
MRQAIHNIGLLIFIILILISAGCVTPPKGGPSSPAPGSSYSYEQTPPATTTTPSYVNAATPFGTPVQTETKSSSTGYTSITQSTPLPGDRSCLIALSTNTYAYNKTAFSFNLKNPPMYINYSVTPTNTTMHKVVEANDGTDNMKTITFSDYSPDSWFEVIARNKTTGEIYTDDGFGTAKGLRTYTDGTIKVMKRDDLLIEFSGNLITATAGIWVKPSGNFDDKQMPIFTECKYWDTTPRNVLYVETATTTPTWTPFNEEIR